MNFRISGPFLVCLAAIPLVMAQNASTPPAQTAPATQDTLVLDLPSNQWFEGLYRSFTISPDGNWALIHRDPAPGQSKIQLYSLKTGIEDPVTLIADLNRIDSAEFFGSSRIARQGERATESGWFLPGPEIEQLSSLPEDAIPVFTADSSEFAYYRSGESNHVVYVKAHSQFRTYQISGRITGMAFSSDGDYFYDLLLHQSGESSLERINVNTGAAKVLAVHLDANTAPDRIVLSADGRKIYLALATDAPPNNADRHRPGADRWLKIYELDIATGTRRPIINSPGQDNLAPAVVGNNLYWTRQTSDQSVVMISATGGKAKRIVASGMVPMWSPDSHRIGYTFGGWRIADWALNLDDAVIALDDQANPTSEPTVIVSGYHEDFPPAWSPDGKWIAFHSHRSSKPVPIYDDPASTDDIYLRKADDVHAPEIRLTDFGLETGPAYWSPDGKKLLFNSWDRNGQPGIDKLYVLSVDTEVGRALKADLVPLPPEIRSASWAAWSPDGEKIAIEDNRGGQDRALWTIHADGSHAEKLLDYKGTTYDGLDWAPDGKTIVFSALADGRLQLFVIPYFGGATRQLTQDSGNLMHPRISPDGKWIACTRVVQSTQILRRPLP